ncbi:hypothetical protein BD289DRAFT_71865 [Coniella lustricola]|uniref:Uncharacterized protein n=1 Tax=Coniella lustricola TaxID=2025994 RepID=A0A2T2ZZV2_9PEZI|nr:hypothetical protein BD289DRAFT_71865 [Coniella lustricola]
MTSAFSLACCPDSCPTSVEDSELPLARFEGNRVLKPATMVRGCRQGVNAFMPQASQNPPSYSSYQVTKVTQDNFTGAHVGVVAAQLAMHLNTIQAVQGLVLSYMHIICACRVRQPTRPYQVQRISPTSPETRGDSRRQLCPTLKRNLSSTVLHGYFASSALPNELLTFTMLIGTCSTSCHHASCQFNIARLT